MILAISRQQSVTSIVFFRLVLLIPFLKSNFTLRNWLFVVAQFIAPLTYTMPTINLTVDN